MPISAVWDIPFGSRLDGNGQTAGRLLSHFAVMHHYRLCGLGFAVAGASTLDPSDVWTSFLSPKEVDYSTLL